MFKGKIPNEVNTIIDLLYSSGYEAYIVGGCVRDLLLGRVPKDFDITTKALPTTVIKLFNNTIPIGLKHGTITVVINDKLFEVTTYRGNEIYTNHRSPDSVLFIDNLQDDLKRRDFTINAMAYNNKTGLVDIFNGAQDLKNKCIRTIGDANTRFTEDSLRMLRAIRFSCELDFSIYKDTFLAIKKNASKITNISSERIYSEFEKALLSDYPKKFMLFHESGLLKYILPILYNNPNTENVLNNALLKLSKSPKNIDIRLAILFCNFESDIDDILHKLRLNNKSTKTISTLISLKNYKFDNNPLVVKLLINKIGTLMFEKLLDFRKSLDPDTDFSYIYTMYSEIIKRKEPIFLSDLKITGHDLQGLGISGSNIGCALDYLLKHCLKNPQDNNKDTLINLLKKL